MYIFDKLLSDHLLHLFWFIGKWIFFL